MVDKRPTTQLRRPRGVPPLRQPAVSDGPHISMAFPPGQVLNSLLSLIVVASLLACSSSNPSQPGPDELVGHPEATATQSDAPPRSTGTFWVHLTPEPTHLDVRLRLLTPPKHTTFFLPDQWAGIDDLGDQIEIKAARTDTGPLPIEIDGPNQRIELRPGEAQWVDIHYRVVTQSSPSSSAFHPWSSDAAFFAFGPTILLLPSASIARSLRDIPIEVDLPEGWQVATTWPSADPETVSPHTFIAPDLQALRDAYIGAGDQWEAHLTRLDDRPMHWVFSDGFAFDHQRLMDDARPLLEAYLHQFGYYDQFSALLKPLANESSDPLRGTGRHGGFVLHLAPSTSLDDDLRILLAHEALHMWNGHLVVPAADARSDVQWFKEGVTHYIAIKTLARLELIEPSTLRRELATAAQFYRHNPLVTGGPARPIDHTRLPYDKGLLIAADLDRALWQASDGKLQIEDWLKALLQPPFKEASRHYDLNLLRESFFWLTDSYPHLHAHYRHLLNTSLDIERIFRDMGLHYLEARPDRPARVSPIDDPDAAYPHLFYPHQPQESP